jgi:hypothetical protein
MPPCAAQQRRAEKFFSRLAPSWKICLLRTAIRNGPVGAPSQLADATRLVISAE